MGNSQLPIVCARVEHSERIQEMAPARTALTFANVYGTISIASGPGDFGQSKKMPFHLPDTATAMSLSIVRARH